MWRFVQVTDPHLASIFDGEWNHKVICSMMPQVMACLAHDLAQTLPDFILATGDIASKQTHAAMLEARDLMDSLGVRYYPMGGNHDLVVEDSRRWFIEAFGHCLPTANTYYSFSHKGLHFCVLDPWWLWSDGTLSGVSEASVMEILDKDIRGARWALPPEQFAWLEQDLRTHSHEHTIVALHYPPIPAPTRLKFPGFKDSGKLENGPLLLERLSMYPQVKAIFTGHVHMNYVEYSHGITQVTTSSLPEFPCEYREIEVHDDRLEIYTRPLSDPSFAERSRIPSHSITAGEERDRRVTISLL
jgi:3',5'-cyclic AMP phosphodiesterase CpdA